MLCYKVIIAALNEDFDHWTVRDPVNANGVLCTIHSDSREGEIKPFHIMMPDPVVAITQGTGLYGKACSRTIKERIRVSLLSLKMAHLGIKSTECINNKQTDRKKCMALRESRETQLLMVWKQVEKQAWEFLSKETALWYFYFLLHSGIHCFVYLLSAETGCLQGICLTSLINFSS